MHGRGPSVGWGGGSQGLGSWSGAGPGTWAAGQRWAGPGPAVAPRSSCMRVRPAAAWTAGPRPHAGGDCGHKMARRRPPHVRPRQKLVGRAHHVLDDDGPEKQAGAAQGAAGSRRIRSTRRAGEAGLLVAAAAGFDIRGPRARGCGSLLRFNCWHVGACSGPLGRAAPRRAAPRRAAPPTWPA
jgi:hypothetical protein